MTVPLVRPVVERPEVCRVVSPLRAEMGRSSGAICVDLRGRPRPRPVGVRLLLVAEMALAGIEPVSDRADMRAEL